MSKSGELLYGFHAIKMALQTRPKDILQLFVQNSREDKRLKELAVLAESAGVPLQTAQKQFFEKNAGEVNHQGVIAFCRPLEQMSEAALLKAIEEKKSVLLLILDGVQDPHNLGACLRSANAMGVFAVIAPKDRAAGMTEVVRKVACGAAEHTPFIAVTNLQRFLDQVKALGVWLVGLDAEGSQLISQVDLKGNIAIVMGNEGDGLRRLTKEACDYLAKIPMRGMVESLNVSVATGIALYEAVRQRS